MLFLSNWEYIVDSNRYEKNIMNYNKNTMENII